MVMDVATETAFPTDDHPSSANPSRTKLRNPLRAGKKPEGEGDPLPSPLRTHRVRRPSGVSRSLSVLNKSDNPARRLSGSVKARPSVGTVVPISDNTKKKSPDSAVSNIRRRRFNLLSSASYWISQIKHSETASKHSISLGFFKLALDCECEPFQLLRDEFREYALKYKILELGEPARDLLERYEILEAVEKLQLSEKNLSPPHHIIQVVADKKERLSRKNLPATASATKSSRASPLSALKKKKMSKREDEKIIAKSTTDSPAHIEKGNSN